MARFLSLPDEIINIILEILFEWPFDRKTTAFCLALTNRRMCRLVLPFHYRHTHISLNGHLLERLNTILKRQPWKGELMRELDINFGVSTPGSYLIAASIQVGSDWKKWKVDLREELPKILSFTTNLRALRLYLERPIYEDDSFAGMPWALDFSCCTCLETLDLFGFFITPTVINTLLSYKSVRCLSIGDQFDEGAWNVLPVMHKSFIINLRIKPRNGVLMWALKNILPSFSRLVKLSLTLGEDMLVGSALRTTVEHLSKQSALQSLSLTTPHLANNMDYDIDLSTFPVLTEIVVDSMMIWPWRNGFKHRDNFYKRLPQTLKRLSIFFPYSIDVLMSEFHIPIDGILHRNCPSEIEPDMEAIYSNQKVPDERFVWIENLVKSTVGPDGVLKAHLPMLEHIEFSEENYYPYGWYGNHEPIHFHIELPDELEEQFATRGIETQLTERGYLQDTMDEHSSRSSEGIIDDYVSDGEPFDEEPTDEDMSYEDTSYDEDMSDGNASVSNTPDATPEHHVPDH